MNGELNASGIIVGGMIGQRGPQGLQGIQGETGEQGVSITGVEYTSSSGIVDTYTINYDDGNTDTFDVTNGTTFTPSVNADGDLSWTNDGDKENPETVNIKGPQGIQGEQGPKGDPGAIKYRVVDALPVVGADDTIYFLPYTIVEVMTLPGSGNANTIYVVEGTGKKYVYESGQWIEITSDSMYSEWIYVNERWEELGGINANLDLTDYVKNTDYATDNKGGVIKTKVNYATDMYNGALMALIVAYASYGNMSNNAFISKGTLDNVLDNVVGDIDNALDLLNGEIV